MIPKDHPRYRSLVVRESLARYAREGVVAMEGLIAHGRGEAFDYFLGERTSPSALLAARTAAALLRMARQPLISVNGNTAALAASEVAALQQVSGAQVEVNLFHRTEERVAQITRILGDAGATVLSGKAERLLPLSHERAWCLREGMYTADVVLVPLEDGDRCAALRSMGKQVIAIDLNPLSRTARNATVTIVDELTRALPRVTAAYAGLDDDESTMLIRSLDNTSLLKSACEEMAERLRHALD
jgi:4-phosphopantoate---beta-alanine ligase